MQLKFFTLEMSILNDNMQFSKSTIMKGTFIHSQRNPDYRKFLERLYGFRYQNNNTHELELSNLNYKGLI